jgi:hypothetical protein
MGFQMPRVKPEAPERDRVAGQAGDSVGLHASARRRPQSLKDAEFQPEPRRSAIAMAIETASRNGSDESLPVWSPTSCAE